MNSKQTQVTSKGHVKLLLALLTVFFSMQSNADDSDQNFRLSDDWESIEQHAPTPEGTLLRSENLLKIVTQRGEVFQIQYEPENLSSVPGYSNLSSTDLQSFHENRIRFLSGLTSVLTTHRIFFGMGSLVSERLTQFFRRSKNRSQENPVTQVAEHLGPEGNLSQRSHWVIQNLINAADQALFSNAQLVATQNEFSISASLGVMAEAGIKKRNIGGAIGLGISFGYNKEHRSFVFEIYSEIERLENAYSPTAIVGIVPRMGVNVINQISGRELASRQGSTVYPPMTYVTATPELWSVGATTSLLSFPPILPEFMVYGHRAQRKSLVRVTVSPATKGWVRLNVGEFDRRANWISQSARSFLQAVRLMRTRPQGQACLNLFY